MKRRKYNSEGLRWRYIPSRALRSPRALSSPALSDLSAEPETADNRSGDSNAEWKGPGLAQPALEKRGERKEDKRKPNLCPAVGFIISQACREARGELSFFG